MRVFVKVVLPIQEVLKISGCSVGAQPMQNIVKFDSIVIKAFLLIFESLLHLWKPKIILYIRIVVLHDTKDAIHATIMHPILMVISSMQGRLSIKY